MIFRMCLLTFALCHFYCYSKDVIYVNCSGKSGSSTLEASFKALDLQTYHRHYLHKLDKLRINKRKPNSNIILIDSFRDVIERKISSFFQRIQHILKLSQSEILSIYRTKGIEYFHKQFQSRILTLSQWYSFNNWQHYGYYALKDGKFDFKKKYQLRKVGNLYFINLRFKDIQDWEKIIRSLPVPVDLSDFTIVKRNMSEDKWYHEIYEEFLETFKISRSDFKEVLKINQPMISHFNTKEEIKEYIKKWEPKIID